jgi:hypothetical protein
MPKHKQNKGRRSHDSGKNRSQGSSLSARGSSTKIWNISAQAMPAYNNTLKKDNSVHRFIQTTDNGVVFSSNASIPTFYARAFTFGDVVQQSSFATLFDQYKIAEVEVWISPVISAASASVPAPVTWYSVVDYDDATSPTALSTFQQYTNVVTTPTTSGHYIRFKPHVAESLYSGAFTSFGNIKAPWIDVASPSVQHYGIKVGCNVSATTINFQLQMRLHFECRNVF